MNIKIVYLFFYQYFTSSVILSALGLTVDRKSREDNVPTMFCSSNLTAIVGQRAQSCANILKTRIKVGVLTMGGVTTSYTKTTK
jgi:hypothetical protein